MPGNPFTEARKQALQADAKQLLEVFGTEYGKSFGLALFLKIKKDLEDEPEDPRKLKYRPWNSVPRTELFNGWCYMKRGYGPGDFSKWKRVYVAENQDYTISIYGSIQDYQVKKGAKVISPCGYSLQRDVTKYYKDEMEKLQDGLSSLTDAEIEVMTSYSNYSWALTHPWRINYLFQLHKGKDPLCSCLGGNVIEPGNLGIQFAPQRELYLHAFDRCVNKCKVRNVAAVKGKAFDMTCNKMKVKIPKLNGWKDNGSEAEMLTDALMTQCLLPMRDDMLSVLEGPTSIRICVWYKTRMAAYTVLEKLVPPAWKKAQEAADKVQEKTEPVLRKGLEPVFDVKNKLKAEVREKITSKLGAALAKGVTPFLDPIFKAFDEPMTNGFAAGRAVFEQGVVIQNLHPDYNQMCFYLNSIPRTATVTQGMRAASWELVEPLQKLVRLNDDVFCGVDVFKIRGDAEEVLLTTLDATMFTLQQKIQEGGRDDAQSYKDRILRNYDHDVIVARAKYAKTVTKAILIANFMKLIAPVTGPVIETMAATVPEEMQSYLNIEDIIDEIVDLFVGEPINKMVDAAYPRPK